MANNELMGHPKGLFILFFTEMWERFSFYGIRAILVLYMVDKIANGGFGWTDSKALMVLGIFQMSCYLTAIPGGMIADRWLGARKSVWFGCLFIMLGNFFLVVPQEWAFFTGLTLIALGGGGLKPNISTILGRLYKDGDPRQESAFSIFYMGINVGAFLSGLVVGYIALKYGWHNGFLASGIGMLFGQFLYIWGQRFLRHTDAVVTQAAAGAPRQPLTTAEKRRIGVIVFSFVSVIVFWAAFEQSGGLLNLYADRFTDRVIGPWTVPTPWFQSLNPLYIVALAPLMAMLWPWLAKRGKNPHAIVKMGIGTVIQGLGYLFMV
ncbi:MAG: peptide MFS transporter, partial [Kiritimatiellae bacterium]|nr:peptide MFS transporter [Kiritimatiellia bacterium]